MLKSLCGIVGIWQKGLHMTIYLKCLIRRRSSKRATDRISGDGASGDAPTTEDGEKVEEERVEAPDDGEVLAVMVHRTDKLKNDFNILHPVVRVHIVDEVTGEYLPKQHK